MKYKKLSQAIYVGVMLGACAASATAELIDRGNGMIYDTATNLTWLQDFSYARTHSDTYNPGYSRGFMSQTEAQQWASSLIVKRVSATDVSGWRLPSAGDCASNDYGHCQGGELATLYAQLKSYTWVLNSDSTFPGTVNVGPFINVQKSAYWEKEDYQLADNPAQHPTGLTFDMNSGHQTPVLKAGWTYYTGTGVYVVAVHDGDVAP